MIRVLRDNFDAALTKVKPAVAFRPTLPITANVVIGTDGSMLSVLGSNLKTAISAQVGAQVDDELDGLCVPHRPLAKVVKNFPEGSIIEITAGPGTVPTTMTFTAGKRVLTLNAEPAAEFPPVPAVTGKSFTIDAQTFAASTARVLVAVAKDDSRRVLTGVKFEPASKAPTLTMACADGFRLAIDRTDLIACDAKTPGFIVPRETVKAVAKTIGKRDGEVVVTVDDPGTNATFEVDGDLVTTSLVQGSFPDYEKIVPKAHSGATITSPRETFADAVKDASVVAADGSRILRIFANGTVKLTAKAEEMGSYEVEIKDATVEGEGHVAFDSRFLADVLAALPKADVVELQLASQSAPGVFRSEMVPGYRHVLMPMFVQW